MSAAHGKYSAVATSAADTSRARGGVAGDAFHTNRDGDVSRPEPNGPAADLQDPRYCDLPVWRGNLDDLRYTSDDADGYTTDDADDASLMSTTDGDAGSGAPRGGAATAHLDGSRQEGREGRAAPAGGTSVCRVDARGSAPTPGAPAPPAPAPPKSGPSDLAEARSGTGTSTALLGTPSSRKCNHSEK